MKTLTVNQLIKILNNLAEEDKKRNVFISRDTEGNGFGTLDETVSICIDEDSNSILIYPFEEYIDYDDLNTTLEE